MPARIKPFSVSPSMAPFLFVPLESAVKVLKGAPLYSSCRYLSENLFLNPLTLSPVVKPQTTESVSLALMMACLALGWSRWHSSARRKRVPIWTPEAPMIRDAATPLPSTMPPAATSGISMSGRMFSRRAMSVTLPSCPPASMPSTMMASAPASCTRLASFAFGTTGMHLMPA